MPKTKKEWGKAILRIFLVIVGTFFVAFGNVGFLAPLDINAGGLNGIAIIVRHFVQDESMKLLAYNLVVDIAAVVFWVVGLLFIGKEFAIKTLVASIAFPVATWFFSACPGVCELGKALGNLLTTVSNTAAGTPTAGIFLLGGIFGGVFVGIGVAITFVGGGSTGGVDTLVFIFEKYLKIKQSIASFMVDGTIVIVGLCVLLPQDSTFLLPCLSGVVSAFVTAIAIEFIYIGSQSSFQVDIISDKWEEISRFAQDELERGATVIRAQGGYKGDERIVLRIVFDRHQYSKLRAYISKVDPKAFVTFTRTNAVFGEGFRPHVQEAIVTKPKKKEKKK